MTLKVALAKMAMNLRPSVPVFDIRAHKTEVFKHEDYLNLCEEEKEKALMQIAQSHYEMEREKTFDHCFPGYPFKQMFSGKKILDLGCGSGGKAVSYAERWNVATMFGIDINDHFIKAARLFASSRENASIDYNFTLAYGEQIPYDDNTFDAIVNWDVIEHVRSVRETVVECKRVIKPGGRLFSVFPSYFAPIGGPHLESVTKTPFLNWFFSADSINAAYNQIIETRGKDYWYKSNNVEKEDWKKLKGGIGINGITFGKFRSIVEDIGFSQVDFLPTPIFSVGGFALRHAKIRYCSKILTPLLKFKILEDFLSHRAVSILTV